MIRELSDGAPAPMQRQVCGKILPDFFAASFNHAARFGRIGTMRRLAVLALAAVISMCPRASFTFCQSSRMTSAERNPANA